MIINAVCLSVSPQKKITDWKSAYNNADKTWLNTKEAEKLANTIMKYQAPNGGWCKNQDWLNPIDPKSFEKFGKKITDTTFDNNATTHEIGFLIKYFSARQNSASPTQLMAIKTAVNRGMNFIFEAQYDNGGWPQYYPYLLPRQKVDYTAHITFNDHVMLNIMTLLKKIIYQQDDFKNFNFDQDIQRRALMAFNKGIDCIIKCQIIKNGVPTVWCQQHDPKTFLPAGARQFEPPAFNAAHETAYMLLFLMKLQNPDDRLKRSIYYAVKWLEKHKIKGRTTQVIVNSRGQRETREIKDKSKDTWARYYDLKSEKPIFLEKDGTVLRNFNDMDVERRNGYSWLDPSPQKAIDYYYNTWVKKYSNILK